MEKKVIFKEKKVSANRTLHLQEGTGHLGAQPVETHVYPSRLSRIIDVLKTLRHIIHNLKKKK